MTREFSGSDMSLSPFIVIWEVTQACDLSCVHCRADAQSWRNITELSTEEAYSLISDIKQFGNPVFVLTGGDPLKRDDIFDIVEHSVGKGLRTTMSPSVTPLLTRESIKKLKESGLSRIAISLDGSVHELHDSFRGINGAFDATMEAISTCNEIELPLQINTTVSKYNLEDIDNIATLIEGFSPVLWSVFFLVPTGRGKRGDSITAKEYEKVFEKMYEYSLTMPYDIKSTEAPHYRRYVLEKNLDNARSNGQANGISGGDIENYIGRSPMAINDGKGFVFISHTGEVFPSGFLPISCGNVRKRSIVDIYRNSRVFNKIRDYKLLKGKCGVCEFKYICGGSRARSFSITGDYMESEPYCAYIPERYKELVGQNIG